MKFRKLICTAFALSCVSAPLSFADDQAQQSQFTSRVQFTLECDQQRATTEDNAQWQPYRGVITVTGKKGTLAEGRDTLIRLSRNLDPVLNQGDYFFYDGRSDDDYLQRVQVPKGVLKVSLGAEVDVTKTFGDWDTDLKCKRIK